MARTLELTHIQYPNANNTNIELGSDTVTFSSNIAVAVNNGTIQGITLTGSNITIGAGKSIDTQNGAIFTSAAQKKTIIENAASDLDIGNYKFTAQQLKADIATGTSPLEITSTTMVSNLNVNYVGGFTAANLFNVGHSSVSGILGIDHGGTGSATTSANRVFIGPSSGNAAAPSFRILAAADLPAYVAPGSGSNDSVAGKVPAATGTASANAGKFLKVDGTWAVPPDTTYTSSDFTHDDLTGFVANEHIDWSASQSGNSPAVIHADNYTNTTYSAMGAGNSYATGLVPTGNGTHQDKYLRQDGSWNVPINTTYTSSDFDHDSLTGFVANEHIDWTTDQGNTNIHSGNYTDTTYSVMATGNSYAAGLVPAGNGTHGGNFLRKDGTWAVPPDTTYASSDFDHDALTNFVANEHIDWTTDQGSTNINTGNYTNTVTSVGVSGDLSTGNVEFAGSGSTSVTKSGGTVTVTTSRNAGMVGEIRMWGGSAVPDSTWHFCDGTALNKTTHSALYTVLKGGTQTCRYGESGNNFYLPDLRGRVPLGSGTGRGANHSGTGGSHPASDTPDVNLTARNLGSFDGHETHTLTEAQMPQHKHDVNQSGHTHSFSGTTSSNGAHTHTWINFYNSTTSWGNVYAVDQRNAAAQANMTSPSAGNHNHTFSGTTTSTDPAITESNKGSSHAHNNMQPFMAINFIIKIS